MHKIINAIIIGHMQSLNNAHKSHGIIFKIMLHVLLTSGSNIRLYCWAEQTILS